MERTRSLNADSDTREALLLRLLMTIARVAEWIAKPDRTPPARRQKRIRRGGLVLIRGGKIAA